MKKSRNILLAVILTVTMAFSGCANQSVSKASVSSQPKAASSGSAKMQVLYAKNFSVKYLDSGVKLVTDGAGRKTLLVPKGVKKPSGYDDVQTVTTPVKRMLLCSSTNPSYLRPLGDDVFNSVAAVTTYDKGKGQIDQIDERLQSGITVYVGQNKSLDYEKIQKANIDVAFIIKDYADTIGPKLEELGIPYIVESSYLEANPLGRMEWTKLFAAFLDKEAEATKHIDNAAKVIADVKEKTKGLKEPTVIAGFFYNGKYYVNCGGSYNAQLHKLAGGDYIFKDYLPKNTGGTTITPEELYSKGISADIFMYEPMGKYKVASVADIVKQSPVLADMKAIKSGDVWTFQPWWYQSVDKLDEIIEDYAAIYHPEAFPNHKITYFYKVPAQAASSQAK